MRAARQAARHAPKNASRPREKEHGERLRATLRGTSRTLSERQDHPVGEPALCVGRGPPQGLDQGRQHRGRFRAGSARPPDVGRNLGRLDLLSRRRMDLPRLSGLDRDAPGGAERPDGRRPGGRGLRALDRARDDACAVVQGSRRPRHSPHGVHQQDRHHQRAGLGGLRGAALGRASAAGAAPDSDPRGRDGVGLCRSDQRAGLQIHRRGGLGAHRDAGLRRRRVRDGAGIDAGGACRLQRRAPGKAP